MIYLTDLKPGITFIYNNAPHKVIASEHSKQGRGGAIMRTKLQNMLTGAIFDHTFKGNENFEEAELIHKKSQYLYKENTNYNFMDLKTFEQFTLSENQLDKKKNFLKEGQEVEILFFQDKAIDIHLPIKMTFKVTYTEPGFKGNTQSATTKPATLETGASIQVPLFIKIGDIIKVDTRTGEYIERA